MANGMKSMIAH